MDETTRAIIERITVIYPKSTSIQGGHNCTVFYDCARLSPNELARLAAQAIGHLPESYFDAVLGLAYHGILFASALAGGRGVSILGTDGLVYGPRLKGERIIIVDDVVATGKRIQEAEDKVKKESCEVVAYACIVDRSKGTFGSSAKPLWSAFQTELE